MNTETELSILDKNLDLIKNYNPKLVENILGVKEITKPVEFFESKTGDPIYSYNGLMLDDEIDPIDWANQVFYNLRDNEKDNIYVVFGLGLGYIFKKFAAASKGRVLLFEPNIEILRFVLELVDFSEELKKENIFVVNTMQELTENINLRFTYGTKILTGTQKSYTIMHPDIVNKMAVEFERVNPKPAPEGDIKVNIGAGKWQKQGWKTLDCYLEADIKADLRQCKPLPIRDSQLTKVFSSHCIEHIETHHLENLIKELYRCMKPGALLRLGCPDADMALEAYKNNNIEWFNGICTKGDIGARLVNTFVSYAAGEGGPPVTEEEVREKFDSLSKDEFINWAISLCDRSRPYIAHINGIYYEKLEKLLKSAGFENIERSSFKKSKDPELREEHFDLYPSVTLFVECNKPKG